MWDEPVIEPTKLITLDVIVVLEPSTVNVPSISVLSKFVVPSTSKSPLKSALPVNVPNPSPITFVNAI